MKKYILAIIIACLIVNISWAEDPPDNGKITLDLKGMDIIDVLKMISQRSGINIVAGRNVQGRVTLFLKDVDIEDAFEIVIAANDLAYERKGNLVNVMTARDYELRYGMKFHDRTATEVVKLKYASPSNISRSLNQLKSSIGRIIVDDASMTIILIDNPELLEVMKKLIIEMDTLTETRIFDVNYAKAEDIRSRIEPILTEGLGRAEADERTNKLIVSDVPEVILKAEEIVRSLDAATKEVLIEAKIVQVTLTDDYRMGVDWTFLFSERTQHQLTADFGLSGLAAKGQYLVGTLSPDEKWEYGAIIDVLSTVGETKLLSSPRISVVNGEEAKILVGTKEVYITTTVSQADSGQVTAEAVNFVDVGVKLYVTPTINEKGFVTMKIRPEVSSVSERIRTASGNEIPVVDTSEAETTIMVQDGATIVIGGLIKDESSKSTNKIPLLGDIPFLGALFRSQSDDIQKKELVIFLTPRIITGTENIVSEETSYDVVKKRAEDEPDYFWSVRDKIKQRVSLKNPPGGVSGTVYVSFVINADGELVGNPRVLAPAEKVLEILALEAVEESAPFPHFPEGMNSDQESFNLAILFE